MKIVNYVTRGQFCSTNKRQGNISKTGHIIINTKNKLNIVVEDVDPHIIGITETDVQVVHCNSIL